MYEQTPAWVILIHRHRAALLNLDWMTFLQAAFIAALVWLSPQGKLRTLLDIETIRCCHGNKRVPDVYVTGSRRMEILTVTSHGFTCASAAADVSHICTSVVGEEKALCSLIPAACSVTLIQAFIGMSSALLHLCSRPFILMHLSLGNRLHQHKPVFIINFNHCYQSEIKYK